MRQGAMLCLTAWLIHPTVLLGADPTLPDSRLGIRTAPILLLTRADVQADLKLSPNQAAEAERTVAELRQKANALRGQSGPDVITARRAIDDESLRWIDGRLSVEQRTRLRQIDLQWEGMSALVSRPEVVVALELTDPQRQALTQAVARRDAGRLHTQAVPDAERVLAEQALATLNDEQKARWKGLLGRPFAVRIAGQVRPRDVERP